VEEEEVEEVVNPHLSRAIKSLEGGAAANVFPAHGSGNDSAPWKRRKKTLLREKIMRKAREIDSPVTFARGDPVGIYRLIKLSFLFLAHRYNKRPGLQLKHEL